MQNYQVKDKEAVFQALGETQVIGLPRTALIRSMLIEITGTVTIATADATSLSDEGIKNILAKIEVVGNGREQIKNYRGANCFDLANYDYGTVPLKTEPGLTQAAHTFSVLYPINFAVVDSFRTTDTYLDARVFSSLDLRLTLGSTADIFVVGSATFAYTNLIAKVHIRSATKGEGNFGVAKESTIRKSISASNTSEQIQLTVGNMVRRLFIKTMDAGDPQNDIINNVILKSGTNTFVDAPWEYFRSQNKLDAKIPTLPDGCIIVDLITDGRKMESLPTEGMNDLDLELDITKGAGTTIVEVIPMELL
ncbi:hypothetical protein GOV14_03495 [Candidatus Pacearchaeota archaeon]|nr:hypothetical protein [Candidatus Pacearchaeota archaeon]